MNDLQDGYSILIQQSDKCGALVIMDTEHYKLIVENQ